MFNTQKLISRIEELEDLVVELRTQNSPQEVLELKNCINSQATEISLLRDKLQSLIQKRLRCMDLFEKNDLYASFQKVLKEREDVISSMAN